MLARLAAKSADFAMPALMRRWQAGESDVTTSLAHPLWLAAPPRRLGAVVHELRGGVAAPENRDRVTEMRLLIGVHARAPRRIVCRAELGRRSLTGSLLVPG